MNRFFETGTLCTAVATLGGLIVTLPPAMADAERKSMEEIVVQAPVRVERQEMHSAADPLVKTETVELSREVYIGDLDLTRYEDVQELEARIEKVAQDSCKKLSDMFPLSDARSRDARRCVERAIESAMADKEEAIAAAN